MNRQRIGQLGCEGTDLSDRGLIVQIRGITVLADHRTAVALNFRATQAADCISTTHAYGPVS